MFKLQMIFNGIVIAMIWLLWSIIIHLYEEIHF